MLNKINLKYPIDMIIVILLSLTYAGISSNIILGFRIVDILLIAFVFYKIGSGFKPSFLLLMLLWISSIAISTYFGIKSEAPFILSDVRFYTILAFAAFLGYALGRKSTVQMEKLYYSLVILTVLFFVVIYLLPFLRTYYVPGSFLKDEHANTIYGPSVVIINYLYVYLVIQNRKRPAYFFLTYLIFALFIYSLRISRQDLVIMVLFFLWSIFYSVKDKLKLKHLVIGVVILLGFAVFLYFNQNERIQGILNPKEDTSFVYRIMSNEAFLEKFDQAPIEKKVFGLGMGTSISFFFNEWFGKRHFVLLDNTPLTLIMKVGFWGLLVFLAMIFYPLRGLSWHKKLVLLFPILFSMFLFSHVIYNLLYIFGLYFVSYQIKQLKSQKK